MYVWVLQVQTLQRLAFCSPSLLYVLAGLLGAPLEGPWVSLNPRGRLGAANYIDRCKLAAGLFKVIEPEVSLLPGAPIWAPCPGAPP